MKMNDEKQQQSPASRLPHTLVYVALMICLPVSFFMIYIRTVRDHHGGSFFGYTAIFSVLKPLAFTDAYAEINFTHPTVPPCALSPSIGDEL
jgi:hypothetical protein